MATRAKKVKKGESAAAEALAPIPETIDDEDLPEVREATPEEWHALIDEAARYYLNMSADEFIRRWKAGEWPNPDGTPVIDVVMLLSIEDQRTGARAIKRRQRAKSRTRMDPGDANDDATSR